MRAFVDALRGALRLPPLYGSAAAELELPARLLVAPDPSGRRFGDPQQARAVQVKVRSDDRAAARAWGGMARMHEHRRRRAL